MNWIVIAALVGGVAAATPPGHGAADVLAVTTALQSDSELLKLHRGYTAYLDAHPDVAQLESAYATLSRTAGFGVVAQAFDEALGNDSESERAYSKYSAFLSANTVARSLVEGLNSVNIGGDAESGVANEALGFLRANPDAALSALTSPEAIKKAPEALRPLLAKIQADPRAQQQLLQGFQGLQQIPGAKENVYPWWQTAQANPSVGPRSQELERYLAGHAERDNLWHTRNAALAATPDVRTWIRYWHGRVQRQPVLARHYWDYLDYMKTHAEEMKEITAGWEQRYGPAPKWPPEGTPPAMKPLRVNSDRQVPDAAPRAKSSHAHQVQRPTVPRPARPQRPELRTAPVKEK
ncbi:MAG: hypothetical protein HZB26_01260 [Candidatus Hydrogenedentes bacterium]|nr:hypothetical protein [Candidatus Hydrogenedentota bacterium]